MKKGLFQRVLRYAVVLVLLSFILLGLALSVFSGRFWLQEKYALLENNAASLAQQVTLSQDMNSAIRPSYLRGMAKITADSVDGIVLMVSPDGTAYYCDHEGKTGETTMSAELLTAVYDGRYQTVGTLDGLLQERCYIAGKPVVLSDRILGAVFVASSADGMSDYILKIVCIFCICYSVVIILLCFGIYMLTSSMVRPLRAMSQAAKCMADGDFSRRIQTNRQDEIGELAQAFNNMSRTIESAERSRRGFTSNVAHELRTPMTIIGGFVDGMLDGTIPPEQQKQYLQTISDEIRRLSRLVGTMLNLSKLEEGSIAPNLRPLNLTELIIKPVIAFEGQIEEKQLEIQGLDALERVQINADPDLMHQAIFNLVENAIKFTQPGGYIRFSYQFTPGHVSVIIRNSGDGIPNASLPHIFDRFYKTDQSRSTDKSGVGLGLNLVKTIVSLHAGSITVRSVEGEYCEFEIILNHTESNGEAHE